MISIRRGLALVLAGEAIRTYVIALNYIFVRDADSIVTTSFGGHLQFLTILALFASLIRQIFSFLYLLTGIRTFNALQGWLSLLTTPIEVVVTSLYWPLKIYKNNLVKDARFGIKIQPVLDRKVHLYPAIYEFLSSTIFSTRRWVRGNFMPLFIFSAVACGYWAWIETTFKYNGFYPYPLFNVLDTQSKALLIAAGTLIAFITYKMVVVFQRS